MNTTYRISNQKGGIGVIGMFHGNLTVGSDSSEFGWHKIRVYEFMKDSRFALYKIKLFKELERDNKFIDLLEFFENIDTYDLDNKGGDRLGKQVVQLIGERGNTMRSLHNAFIALRWGLMAEELVDAYETVTSGGDLSRTKSRSRSSRTWVRDSVPNTPFQVPTQRKVTDLGNVIDRTVRQLLSNKQFKTHYLSFEIAIENPKCLGVVVKEFMKNGTRVLASPSPSRTENVSQVSSVCKEIKVGEFINTLKATGHKELVELSAFFQSLIEAIQTSKDEEVTQFVDSVVASDCLIQLLNKVQMGRNLRKQICDDMAKQCYTTISRLKRLTQSHLNSLPHPIPGGIVMDILEEAGNL